ncbi:MAG: alpha/beta hydrolase [Lysobacterales bacterium]|jgi:pimeloyl-ACP methyl ester carboxylesterase|nr:MAG: alpha/beta hydrolase [Xanthomonadales bacterium]
MHAEPIELPLASGLTLRGLAFGPADAPPIVALHGWLDNAMSFAPLAGAMCEWRLLSIEWPGHGHSDHRPSGVWYHFADYLEDLELLLDALDMEQALLLGHSLGGAVASLYAAVRPERVERLWLIEGLGPLSHPSEHAATALAEALAARHRLRERAETPTYPDPEPLIIARARAGAFAPEAARLLIERSLERDSEGWRWRSDSRLTVPSPFRLCEETVIALLAAIQCPVALVLADPPSAITRQTDMERRLAAIRRLRLLKLPGSHHLHMENPQAVADFFKASL